MPHKDPEARRKYARERSRRHYAKRRQERDHERRQLADAWLPKLSKVELAWAAGLFEGEGTISLIGDLCRAHVSVANTDESVVRYFQERWPGTFRVSRKAQGNQRQAWEWRLSSSFAASAFVRQMLPFFRTERVRTKADLLLEADACRLQGSRDPGYREMMDGFRQRMKQLNQRGTA